MLLTFFQPFAILFMQHWGQPTHRQAALNPKRTIFKKSDTPEGTNEFTVMVVDDNPEMLKLEATMMGVMGYKVRTAGEGAEALFHFQRSPCELVLTDYELPAINGYQLGRKVKIQVPETRVVIMTGLCRAAVAGLLNDKVIDGWLFKPFYMEDLKTILSRVGLPTRAGVEAGPVP